MPIATTTLKSWDEIHQYDNRAWIYRGESTTVRPLKTSIERFFERDKFRADQRERIENELLQAFKRVYYQYSSQVPANDSIVEWLSLLQHHGAPTRCLDFTYSIYVAAYYALDHAAGDCTIWALNVNWAVNSAMRALKSAGKTGVEILLSPAASGYEKAVSGALFEQPAVSCSLPANPFRVNERLRIQKGLFVIAGDLATGFMQNLQAMPDWESEDHLRKIIIPAALRRRALEKLFYMNISRTSLFPGLDGYAQSLGVYHPYMNSETWWSSEGGEQ